MRRLFAQLLELAALALFIYAAFLIAFPLGVFAAALVLLMVAVQIDPPRRRGPRR